MASPLVSMGYTYWKIGETIVTNEMMENVTVASRNEACITLNFSYGQPLLIGMKTQAECQRALVELYTIKNDMACKKSSAWEDTLTYIGYGVLVAGAVIVLVASGRVRR